MLLPLDCIVIEPLFPIIYNLIVLKVMLVISNMLQHEFCYSTSFFAVSPLVEMGYIRKLLVDANDSNPHVAFELDIGTAISCHTVIPYTKM